MESVYMLSVAEQRYESQIAQFVGDSRMGSGFCHCTASLSASLQPRLRAVLNEVNCDNA